MCEPALGLGVSPAVGEIGMTQEKLGGGEE